ncbi:putative envelope-like protein, partial [Trifolium pratense]
ESGFTFHHKLFGNHNVTDHVETSAAGAGVMTKKEIIAGLKVQCQEIVMDYFASERITT